MEAYKYQGFISIGDSFQLAKLITYKYSIADVSYLVINIDYSGHEQFPCQFIDNHGSLFYFSEHETI